jgi:hypothetical protein
MKALALADECGGSFSSHASNASSSLALARQAAKPLARL